jgi:uncharacterized protein (TIGR03790 family)
VLLRAFFLLAIAGQTLSTLAGGSGLNVVVVVNQNSTNSVQLGNDYCEKRGVPPQNLFRMTTWTGGAVSWIRSEFEGNLRDPLLAMLAAAGLTNQIEYVLLSMDIPYRVQDGDSANSTTSALFYGFKTNTAPPPGIPVTCSLPDYSSNSFAFSEMPFNLAKPNTAETNGFLTFMLTDDTLAGTETILSRGLAADGSFPTQAVYLEKTSDAARNVRFFSFDNAIFDSRVRGDSSVVRITSDSTSFTNIRGLLTGFANLGLPANAFVPGAFGDSLTSFAGDLFENTGQSSLLVFLNAGAVASYGTVVEPCNYLQKFPDPLAYFYQTRGFSLAEAYYQSLLNPYQGVFVGEPLCAPFALPGQADWQGLTNGTVLSANASLPTALFSAAATNLPIGQVDLFMDGNYVRTLTNIPPATGDLLSVTLNGSTVQYIVPDGATLASVAAGLAGALNNESNTTKVAAIAAGDRLELQSLDLSTPGSNVLLSASAAAGSSSTPTTTLSPARQEFTDTVAAGYLGLAVSVSNSTAQDDWLQLQVTKTNGIQVSISVTNSAGDTNVADLCELLMGAIDSSPELQGADGALASDLYPDNNMAQFFLYSRSPGWAAAQAQVILAGSPDLLVMPPGTNTLEDNLSDLRPRNHLYIGAGLGSLPLSFTLDTTQFSDGFHELTLVGYEGTSVRTQTRVSRSVQVQNTSLSASLVPQILGTNVTLDTPLNISVVASTNAVATIELFSSGGSIGIVSNQQSAAFSVPSPMLGLGMHPFYALVTDSSGNQFRTQTLFIRIVPSFQVNISALPFALSWASVPGFTYEILSSTTLSGAFQKAGSVTASGTNAQWVVPSPAESQTFFRIQLSP